MLELFSEEITEVQAMGEMEETRATILSLQDKGSNLPEPETIVKIGVTQDGYRLIFKNNKAEFCFNINGSVLYMYI